MNPDSQTLETRIDALETRLRALEDSIPGPSASAAPGREAAEATNRDELWALDELLARAPQGAVLLAGHLPEAPGPCQWQWARPTDHILGSDWGAKAPVLDALGNPVRLTILQLILAGVATTGALAEQDQLGSTGQIHHHLKVLLSAGWLHQTARGRYAVPATRIVPLMALMMATETA